MKSASKKAKGKALEKWVASELRRSGADPDAQPMPLSGALQFFKGDIRTRLGYHIECKNQETWKPKEWLRIAESQRGQNEVPLVIMKSNFEQPVALLPAADLINLIAELEGTWDTIKKLRQE